MQPWNPVAKEDLKWCQEKNWMLKETALCLEALLFGTALINNNYWSFILKDNYKIPAITLYVYKSLLAKKLV